MSYNIQSMYFSDSDSEREEIIMEEDEEVFYELQQLSRNLDREFSDTEQNSDDEGRMEVDGETIIYNPNFMFRRTIGMSDMGPFLFPEMDASPISNMDTCVSVYIVEPTVHSKEMEAKVPTKHSDCPICLESFEHKYCVTTNCDHVVCKDCMVHHLKSFKKRNAEATCALCRTPYSCLETLDAATFDAVQSVLNTPI